MHGEEEGEDPASFAIFFAEGETLAKQEEYQKAIESYSKALDIQANERACLVARSKCYLQLGNAESALQDAEASLKENKDYHKGLYQKADALYQMGDFEYALVYYHRGKKQRPDLAQFDLGINKAQKAINNSIGTPDQCHLEKIGDLSWFQQQVDMSKQKGSKIRKTIARPTIQPKSKAAVPQKNVASDKTMKHLLGELYLDREYMSELLKDQSLVLGSKNMDILNWLQEGLTYLDSRADFWRQQKPMYARNREKQLRKIKPTPTQPVGSSGRDYTKFVFKSLEEIDLALENGNAEASLRQAQALLKTVQSLTDKDLANRNEFIASLYSVMGSAYFELVDVDKSLEYHLKDYQIVSEKGMSRDALARALDNLGRIYSIKSEFQKSIEFYQKRLPLIESAEESTWLFHELGRSHLELGNIEEATECGEKSLAASKQSQDQKWEMNANVLIAQSQVKSGDLMTAVETFKAALQLAILVDDEQAQEAIKIALDNVNSDIVQGLSSNGANEDANDEADVKTTAEDAATTDQDATTTDQDATTTDQDATTTDQGDTTKEPTTSD